MGLLALAQLYSDIKNFYILYSDIMKSALFWASLRDIFFKVKSKEKGENFKNSLDHLCYWSS